ncbi:MAG: hypothetical protein ACP5MB_06440 [bacterium]
MPKVKFDREKLKNMLLDGATREDFYKEVIAEGGSTGYAKQLYRILNGKNISKEKTDVQNVLSNTEIEQPKIVIEQSTENQEASTLKNSYKKMLESLDEKENKEEIPESDINIKTDENQEQETGSGNNMYHLRLGSLLHMIGKNLNNFVWEGKPITPEEEMDMKPFADEVEASFGEEVLGKTSPWFGYALAYGLIPMVARIDLIPKRIKDFKVWLDSIAVNSKKKQMETEIERAKEEAQRKAEEEQKIKKEEPQVQQNVQVKAQPVEFKTEDNKTGDKMPFNFGRLSKTQQDMITYYKSQGYEIDNDFDPNLPIDAAALTEKHLKNKLYRI